MNANTRIAGRLLLAALVSGAGASLAPAAVVVFDNSAGIFEWRLSVRLTDGSTSTLGTYLDITQPPTQSGARLPGTFGQWFQWNTTGSEPAIRFIEGAQQNEKEQAAKIKQTLQWNNLTIKPITIRQYATGQSTTPDDQWGWQGDYFYHLPFQTSFSEGTPAIDPLAYLGMRIQKNGRYHYGWILFQDYTTPIGWAYETVPDTMITVPAPGMAGAIGVLASVVFGRRSRR